MFHPPFWWFLFSVLFRDTRGMLSVSYSASSSMELSRVGSLSFLKRKNIKLLSPIVCWKSDRRRLDEDVTEEKLQKKKRTRKTSTRSFDGSITALKPMHVTTSTPTIIATITSTPFEYWNMTVYRKEKQKRSKMRVPRRPSSYWTDIHNLEEELRSFWSSIDVPISKFKVPPIPNEFLLDYFRRYDLRYAIANFGGRESLNREWFQNQAFVLPGKWKLAMQYSPSIELQSLLTQIKEQQLHVENKNKDGVIVSVSFQTDENEKLRNMTRADELQRQQSEQPRKQDRKRHFQDEKKPKYYWRTHRICEQLYQYLQEMKLKYNRPSIYMPRLSELTEHGYDDLKQAIRRYYHSDENPKTARIQTNAKDDTMTVAMSFCQIFHLIPYEEWKYFEEQLELFLLLHQYLVTFCNLTSSGSYSWSLEDTSTKDRVIRNWYSSINTTSSGGSVSIRNEEKPIVFPKLYEIKKNSPRLFDLIMNFGGRKIVSNKVGMCTSKRDLRASMKHAVQPQQQMPSQLKNIFQGMSYGKFSLDFGIRLLLFIRTELLDTSPSLLLQPSKYNYNKLLKDDLKAASKGVPSTFSSDISRFGVGGGFKSIQMPTIAKLIEKNERQLAQEIILYGGHENIARRLNLSFDNEELSKYKS